MFNAYLVSGSDKAGLVDIKIIFTGQSSFSFLMRQILFSNYRQGKNRNYLVKKNDYKAFSCISDIEN